MINKIQGTQAKLFAAIAKGRKLCMGWLKQGVGFARKHKAAVAIFGGVFTLFMTMSLLLITVKEITITIDGVNTAKASSLSFNIGQILQNAGIEVDPRDIVEVEGTENNRIINITRAREVTVKADGTQVVIKTALDDIAQIISEAGITLTAEDIVNPSITEPLCEQTIIEIKRVTYETLTETQSIDFKTNKINSDSIYKGETKVTTKGVKGEKELIYTVKMIDGEQVEKELVSEKITKQATDKVISVGTKPVPAPIVTANTPTTYKKMIQMSASAYTYGQDGGNITATGVKTRYGLVAVDPKVIPLGTKLYIETADGSFIYGEAVAADTGGAIKGNKIDLFMETYSQAMRFGRRTVNVYIL